MSSSKKISGTDRATREHVTKAIDPKRYEQSQRDIGGEITQKILAFLGNMSDDGKMNRISKIMTATRKKYMDRLKREWESG